MANLQTLSRRERYIPGTGFQNRESAENHVNPTVELRDANNVVYWRRLTLMNEYIGLAVSFVLAGGIAALMVVLGSTLGKKNPTSVKLAPFECGKDPFSLPVGRFAIKFYLIGILFVLFDVELVFLYPWAVVYRGLGLSGLAEIGIFLGILMVGFVYAWDNGALNWR